MLFDIHKLKTIYHISSSFDFDLYELVFKSNFRRYLIIQNDKIIYQYNSLVWACKRFDRLIYENYGDFIPI